MKEPAVLSWSSGKDAAFAYQLLRDNVDYDVSALLTTINSGADRVFMHGVREAVLDAQAAAMRMPLHKVKLPPSPDDALYKAAMKSTLCGLRQHGITTCAFGDIFLEDLKIYREQQLAEIGFRSAFPLWKMDTCSLVAGVEDAGIEAIIVCVDGSRLSRDFLGKKITRALLSELPAGVDACGENGEYHTLVYDAPFFSAPLNIRTGEVVHREYAPGGAGFYFLDVLLE